MRVLNPNNRHWALQPARAVAPRALVQAFSASVLAGGERGSLASLRDKVLSWRMRPRSEAHRSGTPPR